MPTSIPPDDDDASHYSTTPSKASGSDNNAPETKPTKGNTGSPNSEAINVVPKTRVRSNSRRTEPTLLTDFLRGKQTPARVAADRKRRESIEAVKAELRHEMKQSSVRRLQQPGGVRERVQKWQKTNASAMQDGDPDDAATEPTDVAFRGEDLESVTESDRVRIKFRQKKRSTSKPKPLAGLIPPPDNEESGDDDNPPLSPPKKRVISDEHWKKPRARKTPPRKVSKSLEKSSASSSPLPSNFVLHSGGKPSVSTKIQEWTSKIEIPDSNASSPNQQTPRSGHRSARSVGAKSEAGDSASDITARWVRQQEGGSHTKSARTKTLQGVVLEEGARIASMPSTTSSDDIETWTQPESEIKEPKRASRSKARKLSLSKGKYTSDNEDTPSPTDATDVTRENGLGQGQQTEDQNSKKSSRTEGNAKRREAAALHTPSNGKTKSTPRQEAAVAYSELPKSTDDPSNISEEQSNLSAVYNTGSDLASSLANKSIADIPGEIPWGHSAFSELDLTVEGQPRTRPKRPKDDHRAATFKTMPSVFKKVVEESKKIIHEMNEPPRESLPNKPPSIEKWLNNTVDPFVDSRSTELNNQNNTTKEERFRQSVDVRKTRRRSSQERKSPDLQTIDCRGSRADGDHTTAGDSTAITTAEKTPTPVGLKRSRATRSHSSPLKPGNGKIPLLGVIREAFQGESSGHLARPRSYQSTEQRSIDCEDGGRYEASQPLRPRKPGPLSPALKPLARDDPHEDDEPNSTRLAAPRLRPPTKGDHELSTIASEDNSSAVESDFSSDVTQSTVTQSTVLTGDSEMSKSHANHEPGLKRRLTKHSDLVSVLSLPDDSSMPNAIKSHRSRPSFRKQRNSSSEVTAQELLREFVDDESMYLRELKTLVDGVVPVLLSHVVNGTNSAELFGTSASGQIPENVSKSVVNMGVALEKLNNAHKKAPATDIRKMTNWAHGVVSMYNSYLNAWRLGFDDIVVNLAPPADGLDDQDSLLNALPRNEWGDVINANGDRVPVAHLLKRPLIRVKQITKLLRCVDAHMASYDTQQLLRDFENLQNKARRRFKEESARIVDEEAIATDVSRCRDLATLESSSQITINPRRQVSAKDLFSLSLSHSNGQRLDCHVELIHRDNQRDSSDEGDLLVRETGEGRRSYLLFPPISISKISARTGDSHFDMVVMVRGTSNDRLWREFFTLTADNEDQILDWLDILPLHPIPPLDIMPRPPSPCKAQQSLELPVTPDRPKDSLAWSDGDASPEKSPRSPIAKDFSTTTPTSTSKKSLPVRYHPRSPSLGSLGPGPLPATPLPSRPEQEEMNLRDNKGKTPTNENHASSNDEARGRSLKESMRPDPVQFQDNRRTPAPNTTPFREDGAPPPPVHKTLGSNQQTGGVRAATGSTLNLSPTADLQRGDRLKRRTSSPLKHEYLPSDQSSISEVYTTEESDPESSDDEIESLDIPETELGFSIRPEDEQLPSRPTSIDRALPQSEYGLTPSRSASQADDCGSKSAPREHQATRFMAHISRWSDKGSWKDVMADPCALVVTDGLIEAYTFRSVEYQDELDPPVLALDLTPLVLIRQSTAVDLEIRSAVQSHSKLYRSHSGGNFRFRCLNAPECYNLYMSVHQARLNNRKFIQLENEARFKSFGERMQPENDGDDTSSRRRSWFGRKNSYRSSVRAPSQSHDGASTTTSSTPSASSFLKRLTVNGNLSFNIAGSSIGRQSRNGSGRFSLYTSGSSSASGTTPPRSPSASVENSGQHSINVGTDSIRIRLHLLVTATKWEDFGNCILQIRRPPPGWRQALRADHGLEKRITVTTLPKKDLEDPKILLDAVLGSGCFSPMGSRGVVCGVWEEVKNNNGVVGMVPEQGATGGNIKKWCFQFSTAGEASGVLRLVHSEILRAA